MEENRSSSNISPERYFCIYSRTHAEPAAVSSPGGGDGGGTAELFYCTAVDTEAGTWSGQRWE